MHGVTWVEPGRALLHADVRARDLGRLVERATSVQFDAPLPAKTMQTLAHALREHPDVALYVYGHSGWDGWDSSLDWLAPFSHLRSLHVAIMELSSIDGIQSLVHLESLALRTRRSVSLDALATLVNLSDLSVDVPRAGLDVLADLTALQRLNMAAARGALASLADHQSLQRLWLHQGTERDFTPLTRCAQLRDLSIWGIRQLQADDLQAIGDIATLEALVVGAARNVTSLDALADGSAPVRYLELEAVSGLDTIEALGRCTQLRACTLFDSRPRDRSLQAFIDAPCLKEVFVGGSAPFPKPEVDKLAAAFADRLFRYRQTNVGPEDTPRLSWRGLFPYVDQIRNASP